MSSTSEVLIMKTNRVEYAKEFCKMFPEVLKDNLAYPGWDNLFKQVHKKRNGESSLMIRAEPLLNAMSDGYAIIQLIRAFIASVPEAIVVCDYSRSYDNTPDVTQIHITYQDKTLRITSIGSWNNLDGLMCENCDYYFDEFVFDTYQPGIGIVCPDCGTVILPEYEIDYEEAIEILENGEWIEQGTDDEMDEDFE